MKYLRRLIWYICSRLLVLCCILGLIVMAFYFSMNATNCYILLKDGMAKRAQVIMMGSDVELSSYFAPAYLDRIRSWWKPEMANPPIRPITALRALTIGSP